MSERTYVSASGYRFGYQGSEKDDEITNSTGDNITTHFREYDTRIGRTWSIDPALIPSQSPYVSMNNNPISFNDPLGDEIEGSRRQKRAFRKREKAKGTWKETKKTYKGKNSERDLKLISVKDDHNVKDIDHAEIQEATRTGGDKYPKQDYLYHSPLTITKTRTFTFDNRDIGGYIYTSEAVVQQYKDIFVGQNFKGGFGGNMTVDDYLAKNRKRISASISTRDITIKHDDVAGDTDTPARYIFNLNGGPWNLGAGSNVLRAGGGLEDLKYNISVPLNQADKIDVTGIRQSVRGKVDACNGFAIRITVTITKYSKQ